MPLWNERPLFSDPAGMPVQGGVLLTLAGQAKQNGYVRLGDLSVEAINGSRGLMVRMSEPVDPDRIVDQAVGATAHALDLLAASAGPIGTLDMDPQSVLSWRVEAGRRIARITAPHGIAFRADPGPSATHLEGDAAELSASALPVYHESLRFHRLSQCTDDLFDAFRNTYLAMESVLSDIAPRTSSEPEGKWLMRAMETAQSSVDLSPYLGCSADKVPASFYDRVYKSVRCPLFHARDMGLDSASLEDRALVMAGYRYCVECFIALAAERYNFQVSGGVGLTAEGFALLDTMLGAITIQVGTGTSEDVFGPLVELSTKELPQQPNRIRAIGRAVGPFADA
ncbi:MAG: hypothetical protein PF636_04270, partial [Actinomycetota bacterium]|nr:hypothetical protein [Actinomycetota bacterium]